MDIITGVIFFIIIIFFLTRNKKKQPKIYENVPTYTLSEIEKQFFNKLNHAKIVANLHGNFEYIKSTGGHFTVNYNEHSFGCYVGKIKLSEQTFKFAVIKTGNSKASKLFPTIEEAETYIKMHSKSTYEIEKREICNESFIQYSTDLDADAEWVYSDDYKTLFAYIPKWITYIKNLKSLDEV